MRALLLSALGLTIASSYAGAQDFKYYAPGVLMPPSSGPGRSDRRIYARDIIFPLELGENEKAVLNSQVYRPGGMHGGDGSQCAPVNYSMPWVDVFCEKRTWRMPLCPSGSGHQGVDIRPAACHNMASRAVAVENGTVLDTDAHVSMVKLRRASGTVYRYLHMEPSSFLVSPGDRVQQGAPLGKVSNLMNGAHETTWHLHFDMQMRVSTGNSAAVVFVPPYSSLIVAYRKLKNLPPLDNNGTLDVDSQREMQP